MRNTFASRDVRVLPLTRLRRKILSAGAAGWHCQKRKRRLGPGPARRHLRSGPGLDRRSLESLRSDSQVEPIKIHDLVPRSHKVTNERFLRVVTGIDFRDGSELGVRTEDEVDGGAGPLDLTC